MSTTKKNSGKKVTATKIKKGDIMVLPYWVKVESVQNKNKITVSDIDEMIENTFDVTGEALIEQSYSADQYETEVKVTKTELAELLVSAKKVPFTVAFEKQNKKPGEDDRVLRGRLISAEPLMGRSEVEDLDLEKGKRFRQVDHRTIKWLIIENTKYSLK